MNIKFLFLVMIIGGMIAVGKPTLTPQFLGIGVALGMLTMANKIIFGQDAVLIPILFILWIAWLIVLIVEANYKEKEN